MAIGTAAVITTPMARQLAGAEHPYVPTGRWEQAAIAVLALAAASALIVAARRGTREGARSGWRWAWPACS